MVQVNPLSLVNGNHTRYVHVVGWGTAVPDQVMTNNDLMRLVDTSDEWIQERTGIAERRIAEERESVVTLGVKAAQRALQKADMLPQEIDLVIVATSTPQYLFPSTASLIQDQLGATHAGAFDLVAACTGFIYAIGMAQSHIRAGAARSALVIGAETFSRILDWSDRGTCILFGDGAGAFVLKGSDKPGGIRQVVMHSDGSGANLLYASTGMRRTWNGNLSNQDFFMNGREVFRFATRVMVTATNEAIEKSGFDIEDVDLIVPHQANIRIIQAAAKNLKLPEDRFYVNLHKYGNTSAASIPIAVAEAIDEGCIRPYDKIVLVGFGAGLTWGAAFLEWGTTEPAEPSSIRDLTRRIWYAFARVRSALRRAWRTVEKIFVRVPGEVYGKYREFRRRGPNV